MVAQFVDVSAWQPENIDWQAYKAWSASGDGISRVAMRSSYGVGYKDVHFDAYRSGALAAGIDSIIFYHYAYPSINKAVDEANSQRQIVGDIRPQDIIILDFEENVFQAASNWAVAWLGAQESNYGGKLPGIYASPSYIAARLQNMRLARYPLWLADWEFSPDERPPCPFPWTSYEYVQYTDKAISIPGIAGTVDANIFLGKEKLPMTTTIPTGWTDSNGVLTAPNGVTVVLGFRDHVLANNWDKDNYPLAHEYAASPVEQSNPSIGNGTAQDFRWKRLEYTSDRGVFEGWIGQELEWYQSQYKAFQTSLSTLQGEIAKLQALPIVDNLNKIQVIGQTIKDDIDAIMKLAQVQ